MARRAIIAVLLAAAGAAPTRAGLEVDPDPDRLGLADRLTLLEDRGGRLTLAEVAGLPPSRFGPRSATRGMGDSVYWLRTEIANPGPEPIARLLVLDCPLLERILVGWREPDGRLVSLRGGLRVPLEERTLQHAGAHHVAALRLSPGERRTVLVRLETPAANLLPPELWKPAAFERDDHFWVLAYGAMLGAAAIVLLLHLLVHASDRDPIRLLAAGFMAAAGAWVLSFSGVGSVYLWPGWPGLALVAPSISAGVGLGLGLALVRRILGTALSDPALDRVLAAVAALAIGCGLLAPLARGVAPQVVALLVAVGAVAVLAASLRAWRAGRAGPFLLASTASCFAGGLPWVLVVLGVALPSALALRLLHGTFALAAAAFTAGLAGRSAATRALDRARLEAAVESRTAEAAETVRRLHDEAEERKRAAAALAESEERFRIAFETNPDAVSITRSDNGEYLAVNQGFTRISGWPAEQLIGRTGLEMGIWVDAADRMRLVESLRAAGRVENLEARFRFRDRTVHVGLMSAQVIQLGGQACILSVTRDISDLRSAEQQRARLEEQLRQAQKMEAIGRLAGGVAHDFNNLLTVITLNARLALSDLPAGDPSRSSFDEIGDAALRATALTRQLLAFGRRQVIAPRPLDLRQLLENMRIMLRRLIPEDTVLAFTLADGQGPVMADRSQVEQVVVNLVVNARDALGSGGHIRVEVGTAVIDGEDPGGVRPRGRFGVLTVGDDGVGMSAEVLAHVFEPFYTTKGHGTGLGLSTVYGIAKQHGGFVEAESELGHGAVFRVFFPQASEKDAGLAPSPTPVGDDPLPRGSETVLLVEDEESVRDVTRQVLQRLGYRVLAAGDGSAALALAGSHPGRIHALVTDVVMPGLNGRELAERLAEKRPGLPVLYLSGYPHEVLSPKGVLDLGITLLRKPFDPSELARALRRVLAGSSP